MGILHRNIKTDGIVRKSHSGEIQVEGIQREPWFKRSLHWAGKTLGILTISGLPFYTCSPPPRQIVFEPMEISGHIERDSTVTRDTGAIVNTAPASPSASLVPPQSNAVISGESIYFREASNFVPFRRTGSSFTQRIAENQVLVAFRETASEEDIQKIDGWLSKRGAMKCGQVPGLRMVVYQIRSADDLNLVLDYVAAQKAVLVASPNGVLRPQINPNPDVTGTVYNGYWWIDRIRLREAWDVTTGSASIPIAVLDGGISVKSGHFEGKKITFGLKCRLNDGKVYYVSENQPINNCTGIRSYRESEHGTQVASILASRGDDGKGGAGVAWKNPLISIDLYGAYGGVSPRSDAITTYADANAAIELAIEMGARVVNLSQAPDDNAGKDPVTLEQTTSDRLCLLPAMIKAYQNNVLVVIAAGNSGFKNDDQWLPSDRHPSDADYFGSNALIVGATDDWDDPMCDVNFVIHKEQDLIENTLTGDWLNDSRCNGMRLTHRCQCVSCDGFNLPSYTVEGKVVEISAPGYRISLPAIENDNAGMFVSKNTAGTSFAAPMVAGAAALVLSVHPDYTAEQVKQILLNSARAGGCRQIGHGVLDVAAALGLADKPWQKTYVGLSSSTLKQTGGGGFLLTGSRKGGPTVLKLNSTGSILWEKNVKNLYRPDGGLDIVETQGGGVAASGVYYRDSPDCCPSYDSWLDKFNSSGALLWEKKLVADSANGSFVSSSLTCRSIYELTNGSLVISGDRYMRMENGAELDSVLLLKIDENGDTRWEKRIGLPDAGVAAIGMYPDDNDDYLVAVNSTKGIKGKDGAVWAKESISVLKTDSSGTPLFWNNVAEDASASSFVKLAKRHFGIVGSTWHNQSHVDDGLFIDIDSSGSVRNQYVFDALGDDRFISMVQTKDGGVILAGTTSSLSEADIGHNYRGWLLRLDANGVKIWERIFDASVPSAVRSVIELTNGDIVFAGPRHGESQPVTCIIKTDKNGNIK